MPDALFRPEVLEAEHGSWLGSISLLQPARWWLLSAFAALAAAAVVALLACGEYTRRSRVAGQLVPDLGVSTLTAPTAGIIVRLRAEEGAEVDQGAGLVLLSVPQTTGSGLDVFTGVRAEIEQRRASIQRRTQARIEQFEIQHLGHVRQLSSARDELAQTEREIATRREQVRLAGQLVERLRGITEAGYLGGTQLLEQQQSLLELVTARQALERQATSVRRTIAELEQAIRELPAAQAALLAQTQGELAALAQERMQHEGRGELLIEAPLAGVVGSLLVEPGQTVQAGQPLLSLLPQDSRLQARLLVPTRAAGFLEPGQHVLLRYHAYPHQKFGHHGGRILRISRSPINPGELAPGHASSAAEPHYRVVVVLESQTITTYGKPEALRPGMLLEADILGERRKLYEWLLEPLYSVRGRLRNL